MNTSIMDKPLRLEPHFVEHRFDKHTAFEKVYQRLISNTNPFGLLQIGLDRSRIHKVENDPTEELPAHRVLQDIVNTRDPSLLFPTKERLKIQTITDGIYAKIISGINQVLQEPESEPYKTLFANRDTVLFHNGIFIDVEDVRDDIETTLAQIDMNFDYRLKSIAGGKENRILVRGFNLSSCSNKAAMKFIEMLTNTIKTGIQGTYFAAQEDTDREPRLKTPILGIKEK